MFRMAVIQNRIPPSTLERRRATVTTDEPEQTNPEKDLELAQWHQERFAEANKPKRTNAQILRDLMDDPNREPTIFRDGTGRS